MSFQTIASYPYMGGIINITNQNSAWTQISSNRFAVFYQQNGPNILFCQFVEVNGISNPICGIPFAIQLDYPDATFFRAYYVGSNKILLIYLSAGKDFGYRFVTFDGTDTITLVSDTKTISSITPGSRSEERRV